MKPILIIILILALILGVGYWTLHKVSENTEILLSQSSKLQESINNDQWDLSLERFKTLTSSWNEMISLWSVLLHHSEIDSINLTLARIEQYIKTRKTGLVLGEISSLKVLIKHVPEKEKLTLENIF